MPSIRLPHALGVLFVLSALFVGAAQAQAPVQLRFVSLAWQPQAIEAAQSVVADWNAQNPDVQVEFQQVDWGSIHDYLVTSFETRSVPDVFHYESSAILDFGARGYLTELSSILSDDLRSDVVPGAWESVTDADGNVWGVPFLWESLIVLYNRDLFEEAGVEAPTIDDPWTWDEMRAAAAELTRDTDGDGQIDQYGAAFGLRSPVNRILNLAVGFGGDFFYRRDDGSWEVRVGDAEREILTIITEMMFEEATASPDGVGLSGPELFPGFFEGRYAMLPGIGVWARQQIVENAPEGFHWGVLPPLVAETQEQGSATQTLSISAASTNQEEALAFMEFFLNSQNMATLAQGDWLFPTRASSFDLPEFQTEEAGWDVATESARHLRLAAFQRVPNFAEFRSRVATPILQELFAGRITVDQAAERLEQEGTSTINR
ncbi:MAG: sugar ABC transporter substrate-binding protein [Trueperaceae bacterium]|nr:sugar ABC transporter substrate-binding protein [Trueperaceae bacterium]